MMNCLTQTTVRLPLQNLVFSLVLVLELTTVCRVGSVELVGQTEPVVALTGDDVILLCSLKPASSAVDQSVLWTRPDLILDQVHLYRNKRVSNADQNPSYKGRTSLSKEEELKKGNISLKLSRVKLSDAGIYRCSVPSLGGVKEAEIQLDVGAVSQPVISVVGPKDYGVVLKCDSGGWFPKPEMTWVDSDGNILPDGSTETETDSEGRYTVRGHVTVQKTDMFTCRVQQQKINHKMETEINVPGGVFPWSRWQKAGLIIGVLALLAVAVLVGLFIWRKQKKEKAELKRRNAELEDKIEELEEAEAELERNIVDLERELEKEKAELKRELERMKEQQEDKIEELGIKKAKLKRMKEQQKDKIEELEKMKEQQRPGVVQWAMSVLRARSELGDIKADLRDIKADLKKEKAELKKEKEDRERLDQLEKEKEDREKIKAELEKEKEDRERIEAELKKEKEDREKKKTELEDKDKQIAEMKKEIARLMEMKPLLGPGSNVEDVEMGVYINS